MRYAFIITLVAVGMAFSTPAFACKSAGPDKHVGIVVSINIKTHTLILKDAETGENMTFIAQDQLIKPLQPNQNAIITYKNSDKGMVATQIKV